MALAAGSVTVSSDESHSGSGLALAIYLADKSTLSLPDVPDLGETDPPFHPQRACTADDQQLIKNARLALLQEVARKANAYAAAIVPHITGNAEVSVSVTTSDAGLQRLPATLVEDEPTKAPASTKTLGGTVS